MTPPPCAATGRSCPPAGRRRCRCRSRSGATSSACASTGSASRGWSTSASRRPSGSPARLRPAPASRSTASPDGRPMRGGCQSRALLFWAGPREGQAMDMGEVAGERADLLQSLARHRYFLRHTVRDLTDEQAAQRTTASQLCLGGLIKHVALTERQWISFILDGPSAMGRPDEASMGAWMDAFRMQPGETLSGLLEEYE